VDLRGEIEKLKRRKANVRANDLHAALARAGFEWLYGKGDHGIYTHAQRRKILTIDPRNPLLVAYVNMAIKAIEEVIEAEDA